MDFHNLLFSALPLVIVIAAVVALVKSHLRLAKMSAQNLDWYKQQHPNLVSKGQVRCHSCDGTNLGTERLLGRTFLRRHMCRSCGTTLYYSPER